MSPPVRTAGFTLGTRGVSRQFQPHPFGPQTPEYQPRSSWGSASTPTMVVAACDRRSLWPLQSASTAVFCPACSRLGSTTIYQLSYVTFSGVIRASVRPGLFRTPYSDSALEHPSNHRTADTSCARGQLHGSRAHAVRQLPSYSDRIRDSYCGRTVRWRCRLRQSRASEVFSIRASDPSRVMGGTYGMRRPAGVGSASLAYQPVGGGEVVIN